MSEGVCLCNLKVRKGARPRQAGLYSIEKRRGQAHLPNLEIGRLESC